MNIWLLTIPYPFLVYVCLPVATHFTLTALPTCFLPPSLLFSEISRSGAGGRSPTLKSFSDPAKSEEDAKVLKWFSTWWKVSVCTTEERLYVHHPWQLFNGKCSLLIKHFSSFFEWPRCFTVSVPFTDWHTHSQWWQFCCQTPDPIYNHQEQCKIQCLP